MSGIVEGKETGFSKRNEPRELFFPFADAHILMKPRKHGGRGRTVAWARSANDQTVKLSPQPQEPFAFGLSNTNPAAKSSSRQSMIEPIR